VFTAMFGLGFMGETRRLDYLFNTQWFPALVIEEVGIGFYTLSCLFFFYMLFVSIRDRALHVPIADPWGNSRTLEWLTRSPVPFYNFAVTPNVNYRDELAWRYENNAAATAPDHYEEIHMPKNTPVPIIIGVLAFGFGFGMVWRIWWLTALSLLGIIAMVIYRSFTRDAGYHLSAETMKKLEAEPPLGVIAESQFLSEAEAH
jgi:cytochrome o ubiquinol oxidase subunit 1